MRDIDIWRHELFDVINTIADRDQLESLWLGKNSSAISSYEEEVAHVFRDYEIDAFLALDPKLSGTTATQIEALRAFRNAFDVFINYVERLYGSTPNPRKILEDKGWAEVQQLAKIFVAELLKESKGPGSEVSPRIMKAGGKD